MVAPFFCGRNVIFDPQILLKIKRVFPSGYFFSVVGSIVALIVGIAALYFAYYQIEMSREHNRLSVKPNLQIDFKTSDMTNSPMAVIFVSNGLGPAIIKSFSIIFSVQGFFYRTPGPALLLFCPYSPARRSERILISADHR